MPLTLREIWRHLLDKDRGVGYILVKQLCNQMSHVILQRLGAYLRGENIVECVMPLSNGKTPSKDENLVEFVMLWKDENLPEGAKT